jgi:hypothetical protein
MAQTASRPDADAARSTPRSSSSARATTEGPADLLAILLSVLWLCLSVAFFVLVPGGNTAGGTPMTFAMMLLAVFMPVAVIWIGAGAARSARLMRAENARLQKAIDTLGRMPAGSVAAPAQSAPMDAAADERAASLERKLDAIVAAQAQLEQGLQALTASGSPRDGFTAPSGPADTGAPPPAAARSPRPAPQAQTPRNAPARTAPVQPPAPTDGGGQATLALGAPAGMADPISVEDFIRALNFPEDERDAAGFRALRRALKDHGTSGLIRSAQDALTLLSEDGVYMDDLTPDRARPEIWRRFAQGERGRTIAALGGVRDREALARAAGRMRQDPIFRDTAHHFLRKFDKTFADFEEIASDEDIAHLSETRTARAFMLLGRVSGTFD